MTYKLALFTIVLYQAGVDLLSYPPVPWTGAECLVLLSIGWLMIAKFWLKKCTCLFELVFRMCVATICLTLFRFAHAETLIPLLCYMGMFHDAEPLRADNFERQRKRLFRGADLAPFAGNLAFVLYQCPQSGRVDPNADVFPHFSVKLLLHEREVPIPGCMAAPDGSCRFDRLRALFPTKACDLKKMCRKSSMADIRSSNENDRSAFDNREAELTERGRRFEQGGDQLHRGASRQFHREYDDDDDHDDDDDDDYDDDDDDDDWKRRHFRHRRTSHDNRKFRQNRRFEL